MHICVSELTIIGSDNGLSPGRRQAIILNNAGLLLIEPLGTNFSEISIGIQTFSFMKMHLNMASAKWHPFCLGLNVLIGVKCAVCSKCFEENQSSCTAILYYIHPFFYAVVQKYTIVTIIKSTCYRNRQINYWWFDMCSGLCDIP